MTSRPLNPAEEPFCNGDTVVMLTHFNQISGLVVDVGLENVRVHADGKDWLCKPYHLHMVEERTT